MNNVKDTQVVVRLTNALNNKVHKAAERVGLTKASWVRQLIIKTLEDKDE